MRNNQKLTLINNNKKCCLYKSPNSKIYIFHFIFFIILVFLPKINSLRKMTFTDEILLTIKGTGEKSILNQAYEYPPDEIEIN